MLADQRLVASINSYVLDTWHRLVKKDSCVPTKVQTFGRVVSLILQLVSEPRHAVESQ